MLIPVLIVLILFVFLYFTYDELKGLCHIVKRVNEFPGRKGYPILGNVLEFLGTPENIFRKFNSYVNETSSGGLTAIWMLFIPFVLITEPNVVERVFKSPINNNKGVVYNIVRPWLNDGLLTSDGEKWNSRRKLLTPAFSFNVLQRFLCIFNKESRYFVDSLKKHGHEDIDTMPVVSNFTLNTVCETAMGTILDEQREHGKKYRSAVHEFGLRAAERVFKTWLMVDSVFRFSKVYSRHVQNLKILNSFSTNVIAARKKQFQVKTDKKDEMTCKKNLAMLDLLISAQMSGADIDDVGIKEEVDTFIFEGHDTTSVSLCFTLMLLANNKHCQEKVCEELKIIFGNDERDPTFSDLQEMRYLECCIKESLRLYPSVPKLSRKIGEDILLGNGLVIPRNCYIMVLIYEMHRRADLYPNPHKFDPDRFLLENTLNRHAFAYIPFSAGPRNCIGQKFSMMEMKCLIASVMRNYILEPVTTPETIQPILDLVIRTKEPIRVKFIPKMK